MIRIRNPKPYRHIALKLDNEFYERLAQLAANMDRSVSWTVRNALNEWVEAQAIIATPPARIIKRSPARPRVAATKRVRGP